MHLRDAARAESAWLHLACVGLDRAHTEEEVWTCPDLCGGRHDGRMRALSMPGNDLCLFILLPLHCLLQFLFTPILSSALRHVFLY